MKKPAKRTTVKLVSFRADATLLKRLQEQVIAQERTLADVVRRLVLRGLQS